MTPLSHVPCPHCEAPNLPRDAICLKCGKPMRAEMERTTLLPTPRQGLNGRQRAFLRRYVLPIIIFVPLYALLIALLKFPSQSMGEWLMRPIFRPRPNWFDQRLPVPWWLLLTLIDGVITGGILYFIRPVSWQD